MIAELAAFNAAYGVVKEFVANGKDLTDCFSFIGQMTTAKEDLKLRQAKKNSFTSDAEEFAALEQIRQAEDELRELMQYYGRAGLWDDFVKFQAEARKKRLLERNERIKKINQRWQYASIIVAGCLGLIGSYAIFVIASAALGVDMWQALGKIFGSGDVIEKGLQLIDDMHTSTEEEIQAKSKARTDLLQAYAPFKIAQRYLAVMFAITFLTSFVLVLTMTLIGEGDIDAVKAVLGDFYIGEIMLTIVFFYFGGGAFEGAMKSKVK